MWNITGCFCASSALQHYTHLNVSRDKPARYSRKTFFETHVSPRLTVSSGGPRIVPHYKKEEEMRGNRSLWLDTQKCRVWLLRVGVLLATILVYSCLDWLQLKRPLLTAENKFRTSCKSHSNNAFSALCFIIALIRPHDNAIINVLAIY